MENTNSRTDNKSSYKQNSSFIQMVIKAKTRQIGKIRLGKNEKRRKKDKTMQYDIYIMTFYIRNIYNNEVNKHFMSRFSPMNCEYGLYCIIIKDRYQI